MSKADIDEPPMRLFIPVMLNSRLIMVALAATPLAASANAPLHLSKTALLKRADIAATVRVSGSVFAWSRPGWKGHFDCWHVSAIRFQKGRAGNPMTVCLGGIAENDPPRLRVMSKYQMYLERSSLGLYLPITKASWASVSR